MEYVALSARICLCLIFLKAGINHATDINHSVEAITDRGLPFASLLAAGTVVCLILGSISLLLGYKTNIGSIALIIFLILASFLFHNPIGDPSQTIDFLKNVGLIGGLLMFIYAGSGALSVDGKNRRLESKRSQ